MKITLKTQKYSRKPKHNTHTPITIAIPKQQVNIIKAVPRSSLEQFKINKGTATDWYNVTFRIHTAYEISLLQYEESTQEEIHLVLMMLLLIKDRALKNNNTWTMTQEEIAQVKNGLDAMDAIEDSTTRRVLLETMRKSLIYLKQFI